MKKTNLHPRLSQPGCIEKELQEEGNAILIWKAQWPRLEEELPGLRRINRYYEHLVSEWHKRWEGPLLERARAKNADGVQPWSASLTYEITLLTSERFSLWWEVSEYTGARRPRRVRQGDIWLLPQGTPLLPGELFAPLGHNWRKAVFAEVEKQVQFRLKTGESLFREDWPQRLRERLSPEQFYLTTEGPVLFYPIETIAPALEDFPSFSLSSLLPTEFPAEPQPPIEKRKQENF